MLFCVTSSLCSVVVCSVVVCRVVVCSVVVVCRVAIDEVSKRRCCDIVVGTMIPREGVVHSQAIRNLASDRCATLLSGVDLCGFGLDADL
jgi:hypothetical protein